MSYSTFGVAAPVLRPGQDRNHHSGARRLVVLEAFQSWNQNGFSRHFAKLTQITAESGDGEVDQTVAR